MLTIVIEEQDGFDESLNKFVKQPRVKLSLEHSLVSLAKWESRYHKAFLSRDDKSIEETLYYIKCMTITQNVDDKVYGRIDQSIINKVTTYIENPMTAMKFPKKEGPGSREIVTADIIYYWMVSFNIPLECQKWHLNRLLALIKVCSIRNQPPKKMSRSELLRRQKELNAQRRSRLNSPG